MKVFEIMFFNKELFVRLQKSGIRIEDSQYIDLFSEYLEMRRKDEKVTYIVAYLADKYEISVRKVYDLINRMQMDCKIDVV
jgi:hypothetical protein